MTQRTYPLTETEKTEFFKQHLPYRHKMLTTYNLITKDRPDYQNKIPTEILGEIIICTAEASRISCRMFIEFMGLSTRNRKLIEKRRYFKSPDGNSYEVKIVDLGGKWVNLRDLTLAEQDLLARTYETGNKATAHLTHKAPYGGEHDIIYKSIELINQLLETHLYDIVHNG